MNFSRPMPRRHRKPQLDQRYLFQLRIDLHRARPPIWRRVEVWSDITLNVVHDVIQAAFDWDDVYLHRFALGNMPFDDRAEQFVCEYEAAQPDAAVADLWDGHVRLDETLQAPVARLVTARGAAPPEDCGSLRTAQELATVIEDPTHVDVDNIHAALEALQQWVTRS
ncbi:MAG TPA: plasmid pRiA4b ORF-3 family protein [Enteractinococcus sp.]